MNILFNRNIYTLFKQSFEVIFAITLRCWKGQIDGTPNFNLRWNVQLLGVYLFCGNDAEAQRKVVSQVCLSNIRSVNVRGDIPVSQVFLTLELYSF